MQVKPLTQKLTDAKGRPDGNRYSLFICLQIRLSFRDLFLFDEVTTKIP